MHSFLNFLAQTAPSSSTTVAKSTKSSSSEWPLLIIVVLFAMVYILFIRPRQQRLRQQQTVSKQLGIGDQVVSAGGIYGTVVAVDADVVEVEVANGVVLTFLRRAISPRPGAPARPADEPLDDDWELPPGAGDDHPVGGVEPDDWGREGEPGSESSS